MVFKIFCYFLVLFIIWSTQHWYRKGWCHKHMCQKKAQTLSVEILTDCGNLCLYGYIFLIYAIKNQKIVVLSHIWYNICKYWCQKHPKASQWGILYQKQRFNVEVFKSQFCGNLRYWKHCPWKDFGFFHDYMNIHGWSRLWSPWVSRST